MIIGSFVYRDEGDGCLTAKYMHRGLDTPVTECCRRKSTPAENDRFVGTYYTVWIEGMDTSVEAELKISRPGDLFDLKWTVDSRIIFRGKGMLHSGLLVGCYWDETANQT